MSTWDWLWLAWLLAFCILEGIALVCKATGDTLSERVWYWLMPPKGEPAWRLRRVALLAFMCWLTVHFLTRGAF